MEGGCEACTVLRTGPEFHNQERLVASITVGVVKYHYFRYPGPAGVALTSLQHEYVFVLLSPQRDCEHPEVRHCVFTASQPPAESPPQGGRGQLTLL